MKSRRTRLGDLCTLVRGTSPTLKTLPGPYPLVVTAEFRRTADTWQIEGPAVCIPLISSTGHGDAALHRVHYQEGKFALANLLVALLPRDPQICSAKYLYHLLMTRKDQLFVPLMLGTANVSLKERDIAAVEVSLPPLAEQRRVVARIEELAGQVHEAMGLRQHSATEISALIQSLHTYLAGARTRKLADLVGLDEDAVRVQPEESYPQVGLRSFGGGLFKKAAVVGTETTYKTFNRLYEGALLLSQVKGWEGALAVCSREFAGWYASPEYRTFRCKPSEVRPRYLASIVRLEWFWGKLGSATRGVGARRERTRPEQFLELQLPMPNVEQQALGEAVFDKLDAILALQATATPELDALIPAILDRAFKGELV